MMSSPLLQITCAEETGCSPSIPVQLQLIPDPHNEDDSLAVSVRISGTVIGWITRKQAYAWHTPLTSMIVKGYIPTAEGRIFRFDGEDALGVCVHVGFPSEAFDQWLARIASGMV